MHIENVTNTTTKSRARDDTDTRTHTNTMTYTKMSRKEYQYNGTTRAHTTSCNKTIAYGEATTMTEHEGNANNETTTKNKEY